MGNIIDYVENTYSTFKEDKFNEVDSLVLSQFIYMHLPEKLITQENMCIKDLFRSELFDEMFLTRASNQNKRLFYAMASSPRFRNIGISNYLEILDIDEEEQFAAVTLRIDEDIIPII